MNYGEVAYVEAWNRSYSRGDNHIYYPKEETLRFLSKHVRKRVKLNHFEDILVRADGLRGLDFGCGIGRGLCCFMNSALTAMVWTSRRQRSSRQKTWLTPSVWI